MLSMLTPTFTGHKDWSPQSHFREKYLIFIHPRKGIDKASHCVHCFASHQHVGWTWGNRVTRQKHRKKSWRMKQSVGFYADSLFGVAPNVFTITSPAIPQFRCPIDHHCICLL